MQQTEQDKPHIVLISAALMTSEQWFPQLDCLSQNANLTFADNTSFDSLSELADNLLAEIQGNFAIIGMSMGGYAALEVFAKARERITGLGLINTASDPVSERGKQRRRKIISMIERGQFDRLVTPICSQSIYAPNSSKEIQDCLFSMAQLIGPQTYARQLKAIIEKPCHNKLLTQITCPTVVFSAKEDQIMPTHLSEKLASNIPNAQLVSIQECGHAATLEKPEIINAELLRWITKISPE